MKRNRSILQTTIGAALLGTVFASSTAFAGLVSFEDNLSTVIDGGQSVVSGGFTFTASDSELNQFFGMTGIAGGVYNGANGCGDTPCPGGNDSNFYVGLNDGSVTITRNGTRPEFRIGRLDFGFLAPTAGLGNGVWGQLRLTGQLLGGGFISTARDFSGQDPQGDFMFSDWVLDQGFSSAVLGSLTISACVFDDMGACNNSLDYPAMNQAQFGIDNLQLADVPEPTAPALLALGALGMALSLRRRAKQAA